MKQARLQAHRGVSSEYPENTLSAFRAAVQEGYDIVELDTKFTSDDMCVILHDRTLNRTGRTADGLPLPDATEIKDCTLDMVRSLDYGIWKDEKFRGEKIPTLAEALLFAAQNKIAFKFDNVWETFPEYQQDLFLKEIKNAALGHKVGFTCRRLDTFAKVAQNFPEAELHWDGSSDKESLEEVSKIAGKHRLTVWLCFDNEKAKWFKGPRATKELCDTVRAYGEVGIWILSKPEELIRAVTELEADAIETNGQIKPYMLKDLTKLT